MKFLKGIIINLQFFTSLPIKMVLPMDHDHLESSIKSIPLLGLFQGFVYSSLLFLLLEYSPFSPLAIAFFVWLSTILLTGGIHLDGWMDASDAFFSYQDKEKRLEIMKDPRTGAFGVLSILVLLGSRFLFIYEITQFANLYTFLLIMFIPFFSKSVMGIVLLKVPAAKKDGLASLFQAAGKRSTLWVYPLYIIVLLGCLFFVKSISVVPVLIIIGIAIGSFVFICKKSVTWFGGITGDVLGASVEGTEILLWMTLWLLHYFAMV